MMKKKIPYNMEHLIERYDEGLTTKEEEYQLRRFFVEMEGPLPPEWEAMKALMCFEADHGADIGKRPKAQPLRWTMLRQTRLWLPVAAAAVALLVVMVLPRVLGGNLTGDEASTRNVAYIDGKAVNDPATVQREAMEALNIIRENDGNPFSALKQLKQ